MFVFWRFFVFCLYVYESGFFLQRWLSCLFTLTERFTGFFSDHRVDWSAGCNQPGSTQGASGSSRRRWNTRRSHDAVAGTDSDSLGQLPPAARWLRTPDLQLHNWYKGLVRVHSSVASDCASRCRCWNYTAVGTPCHSNFHFSEEGARSKIKLNGWSLSLFWHLSDSLVPHAISDFSSKF